MVTSSNTSDSASLKERQTANSSGLTNKFHANRSDERSHISSFAGNTSNTQQLLSRNVAPVQTNSNCLSEKPSSVTRVTVTKAKQQISRISIISKENISF